MKAITDLFTNTLFGGDLVPHPDYTQIRLGSETHPVEKVCRAEALMHSVVDDDSDYFVAV
eukprot:TRINITY_DN4018_c0_g1_i1.p2 TRINITY_DN4018_c0_g1~~TRINITY_DN4018_c0_g1_i1.p2  ORF type:complete len:60 (-),score=2.43 TRINITY_DN4018_c0_g1_i1:10-189(-)